jgi:hypothetical protein
MERGMFGSKRAEVTGGWKILRSEKVHRGYYLLRYDAVQTDENPQTLQRDITLFGPLQVTRCIGGTSPLSSGSKNRRSKESVCQYQITQPLIVISGQVANEINVSL